MGTISPMHRPQTPPERDGFDQFLAFTQFFGSTAYPEELAAYKQAVQEYRELYGVYDTFERAHTLMLKTEQELGAAERARVDAEGIKNSMANERDKLLTEARNIVQKEREDMLAEMNAIKDAALKLRQEVAGEVETFKNWQQTTEQALAEAHNAVETQAKNLRDEEAALKGRKEKLAARESRLADIISRLQAELLG